MRNAALTWLVAVILVGLLLTGLSRRGVLSPVEGVVGALFSPVQDAVGFVFGPFTGFLGDLGDTAALRDENQELREENEQLNAELVRVRELLQQADELQDLAQVQEQLSDFEFAFARVVEIDPSSQRQAVAIDLGSDNDIEEGMVVVGRGGSLVGRITRVLPNSSWVTLISDPRSSVNAEIQESNARGVVSGTADFDLEMDLVPEGSVIQAGDRVITSGLGGIYPKTLYVGIVAEVSGTPLDHTLSVRVEPAVRLNRLENVLVIKNFLPIPLEDAS